MKMERSTSFRCYFTETPFYFTGTDAWVLALTVASPTDISTQKERGDRMWISLFAVAAGVAICLSVAAIMMQPAAERTFRRG